MMYIFVRLRSLWSLQVARCCGPFFWLGHSLCSWLWKEIFYPPFHSSKYFFDTKAFKGEAIGPIFQT